MSEELKPCPFCGGESAMDKFGPSSRPWVPQCVNVFGDNPCGCSIGRYATKEEAVAAWNRRAEPSPLAWSSERPKAEGFWFMRPMNDRDDVSCDYLDEDDIKRGERVWYNEWECAGPAPKPKEPTK